ncbi:hypothetical protein T07_14406, partial [Trichinella nelsoni]
MVWKFIKSTWARDIKFVLTSGNCSKKCQLTVIAAWRLPCELHNADRSAMTHLAFRRDIAAYLLRARPLQILRPKLIYQTVREAHVDISCSQVRRVVAQFAKKLQKSLCSVWQTASPDRFPNISSAAQYHDKINTVYSFNEDTAVYNIPKQLFRGREICKAMILFMTATIRIFMTSELRATQKLHVQECYISHKRLRISFNHILYDLYTTTFSPTEASLRKELVGFKATTGIFIILCAATLTCAGTLLYLHAIYKRNRPVSVHY